jgi:outer membrane protein TolC
VDLPLERTAERNVLRAAMIASDRATRDREGLEDQIALDVRRDLRTLDLARRSRDIQRESVALAESRVESTTLALEAGRAQIRDRLDAEDDRTQAKNNLSRAVFALALARLTLERDLGTLLAPVAGAEAVPGACAPPPASGSAPHPPPSSPPPPPPPPPAPPPPPGSATLPG